MTDFPDNPGTDGWWDQIARVPVWMGRLVLAIALAVLLGWGLGGIDALVRVRPDFAAMVPTTAVCFALLASALIVRALRGDTAGPFVAGALLATLAIITIEAALSLTNTPSATQLMGLGQGGMSLATQFCMALAAFSMAAMLSGRRMMRRIGGWLATFGLVTALIALVSYALDARALYTVFVFSQMAVHTAMTFLPLYIGILSLDARRTWLKHILGPERASRSARRFLPIVFFTPLVIGYIAQQFTQAGLLDESIRLAVLSLALALMAVTLILNATAQVNAAEAADAAQEIRLRSLLDGIGASVFAVERDGVLRYANTQARRLSEASGGPTNWLREAAFFEADGITPLRPADRPLPRLLRDEGVTDFQINYGAPDGAMRTLRFLPGSYRDVRGERIYTLTCRDVTDAVRARADRNRAERLDSLGQLSGGIAHDIANLLGVIRLNADVGEMQEGNARPQLAAIQSACDRGADLTSRILAFAARQPGRPEVVDLNRALTEAHAFLVRTVEATITLSLELPDAPIHVVCDRGLLENVIINLVLNARDALLDHDTPGARITMGLHADGDGATLVIQDNGPGIPNQIRERVRDPFFTTRQDRGGTGLGLAIVDTFARNNGAALHLRDAAQGGARIELFFDQRVDETESSQIDNAGSAERLDGLRILAVEDDPLFSIALHDILVALGAEVSLALTGPDAVALLHSDAPFDLLLTDITLRGGMNGVGVAREAQTLRPGLPRLYLSGYTDTEIDGPPRPPGRFLQKPIGAARLAREIRLAATTGQG